MENSSSPSDIQSSKVTNNQKLAILGILISVIVGLVSAYPSYVPLIPTLWPREKVNSPSDTFLSSDSLLNILILPFESFGGGSIDKSDLGKTLFRRFNRLIEQKELKIQVVFAEDFEYPYSFADGRARGKEANADIVLWGEHVDACNPQLQQVCINYVVLNNLLPLNLKDSTTGLNRVTGLAELMNGKLQGDIDYLIGWSIGVRFYERDEYHSALIQFKSLDYNTALSDRDVQFRIAHCYEVLDSNALAIKHYENAIALDSSFHEAYYNLAVLFDMKLNDYERAETLYKKTIDILPEFANAHNNLGTLYRGYLPGKSDVESARYHYEKAIYHNPKMGFAYYNLAKILSMEDSNFLEASEHYLAALAIDSTNPSFHYNLARLYAVDLRMNSKAHHHYLEAIKYFPDDPSAHYNLGMLLRREEYFYPEEAKNRFERAIELNSENAKPYVELATLYLGDYFSDQTKALSLLTRAVEVDSTDEIAHYNLASVLVEYTSDSLLATDHYLQSCRINPSFKNAKDDAKFGISTLHK